MSVTSFLLRFLKNPKAFIQRASLKYAYKTVPDLLMFRTLRGYRTAAYYRDFYAKLNGYTFVVPLGMFYGFMKQRPQHIAMQMRRFFPVLYYTGTLFHNYDEVKGIHQEAENFWLINDGINGNSVFDVPKKIYYLYYPIDHEWYVRKDRESLVIYDYFDDIDISPRYNATTKAKHRFLLERADLILASSEKLYSQVPQEYRNKTLLVTNGVDVRHFERKYTYQRDKKRFTLGFYGALEYWIDLELIETIAASNLYDIILIGPVLDNRFRRLERFAHVRMLGHQPYEVLPQLVEEIDLFMLPFRVNDLTKSVSPVKLYEHFATGKPVVSTALPECMRYDTVVVMNHENWKDAIEAAIGKIGDENYITRARRYAHENSWEQKAEVIASRLQKLIAKKVEDAV